MVGGMTSIRRDDEMITRSCHRYDTTCSTQPLLALLLQRSSRAAWHTDRLAAYFVEEHAGRVQTVHVQSVIRGVEEVAIGAEREPLRGRADDSQRATGEMKMGHCDGD